MDILSNLLSFILLYKYLALVGIFFLASAGIPFPTVTIMIASAFFANQGYLDLRATAVAMWFGSILGDGVLCLVARSLGKQVFMMPIFKRHAERLTHNFFTEEFLRHPYLIIIGSRFFGFSTIAVNCLAGLTRFSLVRFITIDAIGEALVTVSYLFLGFLVRENWVWFVPILEQGGAAIAGIMIVFLIFRARNHYKKNSMLAQ